MAIMLNVRMRLLFAQIAKKIHVNVVRNMAPNVLMIAKLLAAQNIGKPAISSGPFTENITESESKP